MKYNKTTPPTDIETAEQHRSLLIFELTQLESKMFADRSLRPNDYYGAFVGEKLEIESEIGFLKHWIKLERRRQRNISAGVNLSQPTTLLKAAQNIIIRLQAAGAILTVQEVSQLQSIELYLSR